MRRGVQGSLAGGGGYNKPPPGPLSYASGGRMRLHAHDVNGASLKERYGSPRERSPSLCSSLPLSPSHLSAREKSPNPTSQDLHDCSMCLSAYIQSLNTVCGTACRLAQCLAQVGADNGCNDASGTGTPLHQVLKEAAEVWEGVARAVGVASTSVKTQMLILLQETQARHTVEYSEAARKVEISKIMRTMLSTFLNLHCQFSLVVVERFSGVLQLLGKDESGAGANGGYGSTNHDCHPRSNPSPSVSPHRPTPSPPQFPQYLLHNQQQFIQQQQQQQLALQQQQQQLLLQHLVHLNSSKANDISALPEDTRHVAIPTSVPPVWNNSLGSSMNSFSSQTSGNTLSPGICGVGGVDAGSSMEAISRRWSMGGTSSCEESSQDKLSSLTPFSLIANRRWSVPETTEHDPNNSGSFGGLHPLYGTEYGRTQSRAYHKGGCHLLSRESSCTRSPSHSRSVTPDQSRRVSIVSTEELLDIIDLLSLPLTPQEEPPQHKASPKHFYPPPPSKTTEEGHPRSIPETEMEAPSGQCHDTQLVSGTEGEGGQKCRHKGDSLNQISTSLWPPTDSVPGVTLTECVGETEKQVPPWSVSDESPACCDDGSGHQECFNRDSMNRTSSWPVSAFSSLGIGDDHDQGGWAPRPNFGAFRRHSTDTPFLLPQARSTLMPAKTRSFENIASKVNGNDKPPILGGWPDPRLNDLFLPPLRPTLSSSPSTPAAQYTLFTTTS